MKSFSDYENHFFERNPELKERYNSELSDMKMNVMLKNLRKEAGLTQEELATRMHKKRPAVTRLENHAKDTKLSTIIEYAHACGKEVKISFV